MFDISWLELGFCAAFALIVIGPKDLPVVFRWVANVIRAAKKMMNEVKGSVTQLEREIGLSEGNHKADAAFDQYLPDEVRQHLPKDFIPGSLSPDYHHQRRLSQSRRDEQPDTPKAEAPSE
ncbi:Sec-independent protein translocase subunit TatA/TatB [Alteromonas oceanisediminis]|uniref:Sec-independent protein translocase subunit TatA/TatB n=1 Tax=Alteromonas oceanisediminis TaxID=2836180 RepID=UPI001BD95100|nr:preprotein translocase subunit TatB [Alteromonas oceanisediminis]MBT0587582.1 preprotein translocase subunit TatB [Alteromonas oceanisediminis]